MIGKPSPLVRIFEPSRRPPLWQPCWNMLLDSVCPNLFAILPKSPKRGIKRNRRETYYPPPGVFLLPAE